MRLMQASENSYLTSMRGEAKMIIDAIPQNEDENGIKIISTAEVGLDGPLDLSEIRKVRYENKYKKCALFPLKCLS